MLGARRTGLVASISLALMSLACGGGSSPVTGLHISEIAFYQGVKATVMRDGEAVAAGVPLVQGRDAFVRVFVRPDDGWQNRAVKGRLDLKSPAGAFSVEGKATVNGASSDGDLLTTINFDVPGSKLKGDFQYKLALFEGGGVSVPAGGSKDGGFFPATGTASLKAEDAGPSVKIMLVPMAFTSDGSGRLPDTSESILATFRDVMKAMYPIPNVEIALHAPIDMTRGITANGTGWSEALQQILRLRRQDNPTSNIYYYGLFMPATTFSRYCAGGCITGLSTGGDNADDATVRASVGVGFGSDYAVRAAGTFIHEVGHAHGRNHSPGCGAANTERGYPYRDGTIGVWGYDILDKTLVPPTANKDFMGYCDPIWVSDFTFKALFERIAHVNWLPEGQLLSAGEAEEWRIVHVDAERATLGERLSPGAAPGGAAIDVRGLDANGHESGALRARFYPFDHLPGGLVFVRESELRAHTALTVGGHTLRSPNGELSR